MYGNPFWCFYTGLALICVGAGFLKPNISIMVGQMYETGDPRKEDGFFIFYMGINLGALFSAFLCGWIAETYNFRTAFLSAGLIMALGFLVYVFGQPLLKGLGDCLGKKDATEEEKAKYAAPLTHEEKDRCTVIAVVFAISVAFWMAFEQAGGLLALYAEHKTVRTFGDWEMPS